MENIASDGIQVLVPPDAGLREGARPGWDKGPYAFMRRVLASEAGHKLYKHRKATVEPVFAQNKFNRGFRRVQRRGRAAARSEWRFQAAIHNLLKLHTYWTSSATHERSRERRFPHMTSVRSHGEGAAPAASLPDSVPGRLRLPLRSENP
jgi:Transposase DDE domain